MKKSILLIVASVFFLLQYSIAQDKSQPENGTTVMRVLLSPETSHLAMQWAKDYISEHPDMDLQLIPPGQYTFNEEIKADNCMALMSEEDLMNFGNAQLWKLPVAREIIVPVMNAGNPLAGVISENGLSPATLANMLNKPEENGWDVAIGQGNHIPVHIYSIQNVNYDRELKAFFGSNTLNKQHMQLGSCWDLINKLQNDPNALAFCKLTDLMKPGATELPENIALVPIDRNANGKLEYFEQIYANPLDLYRGVWIGKFPKELINEVYVVCSKLPGNEQMLSFMKWIMTDGQVVLEENGFNQLVSNERNSKIEKLTLPAGSMEAGKDEYAASNIFLPAVAILLLVGLLFGLYLWIRKRKESKIIPDEPVVAGVINEAKLAFPGGLYYDKTHTWVFMEQEGVVKIGVDDFLPHITGNLSCVKMKQAGEYVKKNEELFSLVQDGKHLNISSPVSGKIKHINDRVVENPGLINKSPYDEGWLFLVEPSNWLRELQFMEMAENYKNWIRKEFQRMKDFLSSSVNPSSLEVAGITLQDGGEISDHPLENLDPRVWEDFQKQFIETAN